MKFKKNNNNQNEYVLSKSGHWVRNFTKSPIKGIDINNLIPPSDMEIMIANEMKNQEKVRNKIEDEDFVHPNIVIIGDGYGFENSLKLLEELPQDVIVIGVNGAFAKWNISRRINYYIINNPYEESMNYYPQSLMAWPKCIASVRTFSPFLDNFQGLVYMYGPVADEVYSGVTVECNNCIDDYRTPICAAISLAYKFKVKKLLLLSLIDLYEQYRPGAEKHKHFWVYPQQKMLHSLIDGNLYWLQKAKIATSYTGKTLDYEFASYIKEEDIKRFF